MLKDIDELLETDWALKMIDLKMLPNAKPYTQKEARQMADCLGKIYTIAHCIHCDACGGKNVINSDKK